MLYLLLGKDTLPVVVSTLDILMKSLSVADILSNTIDQSLGHLECNP